ncbi:MAG TPA: GTPase HflX [Candidatus Thermoplasmatota archaeon]|nr:GTPase HflX [Candidatus Thermoplasmatota archaeon]
MRRKALLLSITRDTAELQELVFALGADVVGTVLQRRSPPDPVTYLGTGKLEDARDTQRALGADLVVVNAALRPGQMFALQRFFSDGAADEGAVEVYDRTRLILEIFRERARSPEARLQVELAQLTYDMPLVKEAINREKKGERQAAMFGGGDYGVEDYYDMMKKRMARIRRDLEKMRLERGVRRKHRRRGGFHLVSLAGYTNAGKSSLLRALSERDTLVEDRYFSTLSTKTARARSDRRDILITDTVGFIEDLPPWMVDAFHSTLEEIALADVILLVVDASDPVDEMVRRVRSSLRTLHEFDTDIEPHGAALRGAVGAGGGRARAEAANYIRTASSAPILLALNKIDRLASPAEVDARQAALEEAGLVRADMVVRVSAQTREGFPELYAKLYDLIPDYDEYEVALPASPESEGFINWLHESADVLDMTRGNEVHLHFEAKRSLRSRLIERLRAVGATALREVRREGAGGAAPLPDASLAPDDVPADVDADARG